MPGTNADTNQLIEQINLLLPQTQCGQCNYAGCKPYAEAIATGQADINQCPPGGDAGILALSILLNIPSKALNAEHGETKAESVVVIREIECIGCTKCIQACPVDAIVGASKLMHTVLAEYCTGCNLCIPPCPVDCIDIVFV
jgi:electron transport complex protein RnfB